LLCLDTKSDNPKRRALSAQKPARLFRKMVQITLRAQNRQLGRGGLLPPALYLGIHLVEGETLTPMLLARRFKIKRLALTERSSSLPLALMRGVRVWA
jgi:hypothetical protein